MKAIVVLSVITLALVPLTAFCANSMYFYISWLGPSISVTGGMYEWAKDGLDPSDVQGWPGPAENIFFENSGIYLIQDFRSNALSLQEWTGRLWNSNHQFGKYDLYTSIMTNLAISVHGEAISLDDGSRWDLFTSENFLLLPESSSGYRFEVYTKPIPEPPGWLALGIAIFIFPIYLFIRRARSARRIFVTNIILT